jgi:DNA-binding Xre family transcriptional regulator
LAELIYIYPPKEYFWQKTCTFVAELHIINNMDSKHLNRIKVVLAEKEKTNKWLAEQLGKDQATISKWVTNTTQPNLEMLLQIAKVLEVNVNELVRPLE